MFKAINGWAQCCLCCQLSKTSRHTKLLQQHIDDPGGRFEHIHMDIVDPLSDPQGYQYVLTMMNRFTRWSKAVPIKNLSLEKVADTFFAARISRFGAPATITSDQGS